LSFLEKINANWYSKVLGCLFALTLSWDQNCVNAYPIFAQQSYDTPREATGRIVCANCHLSQKPTEITVATEVLPDSVFESVVAIPSGLMEKQLTGTGKRGPLNLGAVVILPNGFKLAPNDRISSDIKVKNKGLFIQSYAKELPNILVVGPVGRRKNSEILFPILAADPFKETSVRYLNYPIYVGANRGRGQVYPNGDYSNNNSFLSIASGTITKIVPDVGGGALIKTQDVSSTKNLLQSLPSGLDLAVKVGDSVKTGGVLSYDPNVGGFGQDEAQIVLQDPVRLRGWLSFFLMITVAQIMLVVKKKGVEERQLIEATF
jgi:apocytochrome f